jgi:hypothetical protein
LIPLAYIIVVKGRSSSEVRYASEPLTLGKALTHLYFEDFLDAR